MLGMNILHSGYLKKKKNNYPSQDVWLYTRYKFINISDRLMKR